MGRVLCVDDKKEIADQIAEYFQTWKDNPFGELETVVETNFKAAVRRLVNERFDLVTLDLHATDDPDPEQAAAAGNGTEPAQQGLRVLDQIRLVRFVPVIFYSGYADKITDLKSPVVRIVRKGSDDLTQVREAAKELFDTGLPNLMRHIEEEQRSYIWDTVDKHAKHFNVEADRDELVYLLARRIAARLGGESIKELLEHPRDYARPMELYIYPPLPGKVQTGAIHGPDDQGTYWIVATPACDFDNNKAEQVLLIGATSLITLPQFTAWRQIGWTPEGPTQPAPPGGGKTYKDLEKFLLNNAGERWRFLPGTFFIPPLLVDLQKLKQMPIAEFTAMKPPLCTLDSPYCENFLMHLSKYYGRLGTPDLEIEEVFKKLAAL